MFVKKLWYFILIIVCCGCSAPHDGYILTGKVPEAWKGRDVYMRFADDLVSTVVDSAKISSKGEFEFKGKFETPRYCTVIIYLDPNNRTNREMILSFSLFVENKSISAVCNPPGSGEPFTITGAEISDLYNAHLAKTNEIGAKRKALFSDYSSAYYREKNSEKATLLANQITEKLEQVRAENRQFVDANPSSAASLEIVRQMVDGVNGMTREQMNALFDRLSPELKNGFTGAIVKKIIDDKHAVMGEQYLDMELMDMQGEVRKISDMIKPGHYTMLEFWASWCVPCRGDIPFIKRAYDKYNKKGFDVISISIDSDRALWLKAIEEEKLSWTQLLDYDRRVAPQKSTYNAYGLSGVPTTFLLNDKGVIVAVDVRGLWLDMELEKIFGN